MSSANVARCRSCSALVRWVRTEKGRRMPLDFEPAPADEEGVLFVIRDGVGVTVTPAAYDDEPRFRSHFATCPHAGKWRQK